MTKSEQENMHPVRMKTTLLDQITAYIEENLTEKLTLKNVSEYFGVSVSTVTQLFQKNANQTFHGFVTDCRMNAASKLILKGIPLETVGREVGYRDHSTFYRAFHQRFGVSPREYRKQEFLKETK